MCLWSRADATCVARRANHSGTTRGDVWSFTTGAYPGDFDDDGDVDQEDFGFLQARLSKMGRRAQPGCSIADLDGDGDVDPDDLVRFQACTGGPNRPPAETCH